MEGFREGDECWGLGCSCQSVGQCARLVSWATNNERSTEESEESQ